jgi:hypothetical protein
MLFFQILCSRKFMRSKVPTYCKNTEQILGIPLLNSDLVMRNTYYNLYTGI